MLIMLSLSVSQCSLNEGFALWKLTYPPNALRTTIAEISAFPVPSCERLAQGVQISKCGPD